MKTIVLCLLWNVQNQHIAERQRSLATVVVLISGAFVRSRLIYERCLHLGDTFAYCSAHSNLFLTLHIIHKLKTLICERATSLSRSPWPSSCGELRNVSHKRLPYHSVPYSFVCNILIGKMLMTKVSVTKEVSCIILCKNLCSSVPCLFFIKTRFD